MLPRRAATLLPQQKRTCSFDASSTTHSAESYVLHIADQLPMRCVFNVVTTGTHLPHRCVMHMAITVQRVCCCLGHAQGQRGLRMLSLHPACLGNVQRSRRVSNHLETHFSRRNSGPGNPTLSRARAHGVAQSTPEKPFLGAAHEVKYFCFVISDLPVIASVGSDRSDVRCRSLPRNIPQVKAHTAPAKILSTVWDITSHNVFPMDSQFFRGTTSTCRRR